jgi:hypothetical protein
VEFDDGALLVTGVRIGAISLSRHVFMMAGGQDVRFEDIATGLSQPFAIELVLAKSVTASDPAQPEEGGRETSATVSDLQSGSFDIRMRGGVMEVVRDASSTRIIMTATAENGISSLTWAVKKLAH